MTRTLGLMVLLVAMLSVAACGAPGEQVIEETSGGEEVAGQASQPEATADAPGASSGAGETAATKNRTGSEQATTTVDGMGKTTAAAAAGSELATASYKVPTITCPSCAARVEASAEKDPGVLGVRVEGQSATVEYDPAKTDPQKIADAIRAGGDTVIQEG
jgi:copper chaperone CopZ